MPEPALFPLPLSPGAYIKTRRCKAGLSVQDVAAELQTLPRWPLHLRADWIEQIEADIVDAGFQTIAALRSVFPFDLDVLERLALIALGAEPQRPQLCRICACSEHDACIGFAGVGCSRADQTLCSSCAGSAAMPGIAA